MELRKRHWNTTRASRVAVLYVLACAVVYFEGAVFISLQCVTLIHIRMAFFFCILQRGTSFGKKLWCVPSCRCFRIYGEVGTNCALFTVCDQFLCKASTNCVNNYTVSDRLLSLASTNCNTNCRIGDQFLWVAVTNCALLSRNLWVICVRNLPDYWFIISNKCPDIALKFRISPCLYLRNATLLRSWLVNFGRVREFTKSDLASSCLSAWNNSSAPTGRIFVKFDIWGFHVNCRENSSWIKIWQQ